MRIRQESRARARAKRHGISPALELTRSAQTISYSLDQVEISHERIARARVQKLLSIAGQDERQADREALLRCSHLHRHGRFRCYHAPYGYVLCLLRRLRHSSDDIEHQASGRLAWERRQSHGDESSPAPKLTRSRDVCSSRETTRPLSASTATRLRRRSDTRFRACFSTSHQRRMQALAHDS